MTTIWIVKFIDRLVLNLCLLRTLKPVWQRAFILSNDSEDMLKLTFSQMLTSLAKSINFVE
ncbi:hypothetical protein BpHYR1_032919 [Brachionus plicatilis]|uniref:Uncharacterized protein n=1 Tax=Brachionus plicatilis TaxID=10195 RepID=A0A3M7T5I5_BRAPC|nr:hypothetical protein BpHYR1_032919 [Brachionus plicatilis]